MIIVMHVVSALCALGTILAMTHSYRYASRGQAALQNAYTAECQARSARYVSTVAAADARAVAATLGSVSTTYQEDTT